MVKEKSYLNCIRFDSTSNPCPNKDNEYISAALTLFRRIGQPNPISHIYEDRGDLNKAKEICRDCKSFEIHEK